jgi:MFS family permease
VRSRRLVLLFGGITAFSAAGYGVMFTVLDDFRDQYGISEGALGLVVAIGFFVSFFAQVLLAPLADRGHARLMVILGSVSVIAGLLVMAASDTVLGLMLGRSLMGLGAGVAVPAARRMVILADPANLGSNLGWLVSAVLVGPFGLPAPFLVIAAVMTLYLPLLWRVHVDESIDGTNDVPSAGLSFDLLRVRPIAAAVCMGAAMFIMIGTFDSLWVLVLDDLDAADWIANLGVILFALPLAVLGSVGGRLCQRVGPFRVGTVGLLVGALCVFLYGQLPGAGLMMVVAQGLLGGVQTLTGGMGALAASQLYENFGRGAAFGVSAASMVALVVASVLLAGPHWGDRQSADADAGGSMPAAASTSSAA